MMGVLGRGIDVESRLELSLPSTVVVRNSRVEGHGELGVFVIGSSLRFESSEVGPGASPATKGMAVQTETQWFLPAELRVEGSRVQGQSGFGVVASKARPRPPSGQSSARPGQVHRGPHELPDIICGAAGRANICTSLRLHDQPIA